jgi:hypothetical protein
MEEDRKNIINMDRGMVILHPELILQIQQGSLIGKLMVQSRKSAMITA